MFRSALFLAPLPGLALVLAACGGSSVASIPTQVGPPNPPAENGAASAPLPPPASAATPEAPSDAHGLAIAATACWFGGVWGDALGEPIETRKAGDEARCMEVVRRVAGSDDRVLYEKLRALEPATVDLVLAKVGGGDEGKLLRAFANAQREALDARRAGDKVKRDLKGDREPDRLNTDEANATNALVAAGALGALAKGEAGALSNEARVIGAMTAMERLEASRGLPKHLKAYAMEGPFVVLFGLPAPALPQDAKQPLPKGEYLTFVSDAAKAAGHPVPDAAKTPKEREPLAWAGVLAGLADKIRPELAGLSPSTPLADVAGRVVKRLDAQVEAEKNALATKPDAGKAPASATPAGKGAPSPGAKAPAAAAPAKK